MLSHGISLSKREDATALFDLDLNQKKELGPDRGVAFGKVLLRYLRTRYVKAPETRPSRNSQLAPDVLQLMIPV